MTQIIRLFDTAKAATDAAAELKTNNFSDVRVATAPPANGKANGHGDSAAALTNAGFSARESEAYAGALKPGGAVLSVAVPFGRGKRAEQILDRHGAGKSVRSVARGDIGGGAKRNVGSSGEGDARAAPLSSSLGLPVLADSRPTTVERLGDQRPTFPTPLISSDFYVSSLFGLPLLIRSRASAALIDDPTPFSRWLGLPVLLRGRDRSRADREPVRPAALARQRQE